MYYGSIHSIQERFNTNVRRLRTMNDLCLAQYLGSPLLEQILNSTNQGPIFGSSIGMIRKLPLNVLPDQKLDLVCEIFANIRITLQKLKPNGYGADDILPILEFILIRGMVQNLGSVRKNLSFCFLEYTILKT